MVCKESVNLTRKQKSGKPLARIPTQCPVQFWGRSAGQNARQCTTTRRECNQRLFSFGFPNKPSLSVQAHTSFGNHRTDLDRIWREYTLPTARLPYVFCRTSHPLLRQ